MNNNYYKSMFKNYPDVVNVKEMQAVINYKDDNTI